MTVVGITNEFEKKQNDQQPSSDYIIDNNTNSDLGGFSSSNEYQ